MLKSLLLSPEATLFLLNLEPTFLSRAYFECVAPTCTVVQIKLQANTKVGGTSFCALRPATYLADTTPLPKRMFQGTVKRFSDQSQRIEKIAFAGTVWPDQEIQRAELHGALGNALVVLEDHTFEENRFSHSVLPF